MSLRFVMSFNVPSKLRRTPVLVAGAITLAACGGDDFPGVNTCPNGVCTGDNQTTTGDGGAVSGAGTVSTTSGGTANTAGTTGGVNHPGTTTTGTANAAGMPCDVEKAVTERCGLCHGSEPQFGAPMPLTSQADFQAAAVSDPSATVARKVAERIHSQDTAIKMPPAGYDPLTADELAALDQWLQAGTPLSQEQCGGAPDGGNTGDADGGVTDPADPVIPNLECFKITAHAQGSKEQGYQVGQATDEYVNFHFMPPWGEETAYARAFRPVIDNTNAIHHWLFFKNSGPATDGAVEQSSGTHPGSELLAGWAPGGEDIDFGGNDVGIELPGNVSYTLELHYNSSDSSAVDASGLNLCVTKEAPAETAAVSWLGTDAIFGTSAAGTCDPASDEPIHILGISPHMHLKGTYMKAVINRADGSQETLHDAPFSFDYQTYYNKDVWLMPGDTITTECTYNAFSVFGEGTNEEMCYLFTTATPAGALSDVGLIGNTIHGANACLGL